MASERDEFEKALMEYRITEYATEESSAARKVVDDALDRLIASERAAERTSVHTAYSLAAAGDSAISPNPRSVSWEARGSVCWPWDQVANKAYFDSLDEDAEHKALAGLKPGMVGTLRCTFTPDAEGE